MIDSKLNQPAYTLTVRELIEIIHSERQSEPIPISQQGQPEYLRSIKEIAMFLHCSTTKAQSVKNSLKLEKFEYINEGRKFLINTKEFVDFLKKKKGGK